MPLRGAPRWWRSAFAAAVLCAVAAGASAQPFDPPEERKLAGGDVQEHEVRLGSTRSVRLVIEQQGVDVVVTVRGPGGSLVLAIDSPLGRWATESALVAVPAAGLYRLEVGSRWEGVGAGRYRLSLEPAPTAPPALRAAEEAWSRGARAYAESHEAAAPEELLEAARSAFGEAGAAFAELHLPERQAAGLHAEAALARRLGKSAEAVELLRGAIALWRSAGAARMEAEAWNELGLALWESGDLDGAERSFETALASLRPLGDPAGEAEVAQNPCLVTHARGELERALPCYEEARDRFRQLGETRWEATALNNLGYAYYGLGEPSPATAAYRQALELRSAAGDRVGEAQTLNNLAVLHRRLGDLDEALALYDRARRLQHDLGDRRQEAATLSNLGVLYGFLGEPGRARIYLEEALELRRSLGDSRGQLATLNHLGRLLCEQGEVAAALARHDEAQELARATDDARGEAQALARRGECLARDGRHAAAGPVLEEAVRRFGETGDRAQEAAARQVLGEVALALGRPAAARTALEAALAARIEAGDAVGAAASRATLARALETAGDLERARAEAEAALVEVEGLRRRIASPDLRATFLAAEREAHEVLIGVLAALHRRDSGRGNALAAFEVSERARARGLLDVLQAGRTAPRRAAGSGPASDLDPGLERRRESLLRRLYLRAERHRAPQGPGPGRDDLELEMAEILRQLDVVEGRMRGQSPRYAALVEPRVPDLTEVQGLLGPDTVFLEYFVGESRAFLWKIDSAGAELHELAEARDLGSLVRRVHEGWSALPGGGEEGAGREAAALSRVLLGPVWRELTASRETRRLAVAADGPLHLLPFAALPRPDRPEEPLLTRFEFVQAPSAAVLALQRGRRPAPAEAPGDAHDRVLVVADPVFDPRDERVASRSAAATPVPASPAAPARGPAPLELDRMRFSREEAEAIEALDPERIDVRLDFAARREALLAAPPGRYRAIHVASHGRVDTERPFLTGLVLSRVDERGRPVEGWLRLAEVYGLELDADLVVLSGCSTAFGREVRGEGLLGLARGFLHAGAGSAVASLWAVQDRATAELMAAFYRQLWSGGLPPGAALRAAQLELRERQRWRAPYYWAAWTFTGDWRAVPDPSTTIERSTP